MNVTPASRRRLTALGVDVWVERGSASAETSGNALGTESSPVSAGRIDRSDDSTPRIRLSSGRGRWLLVLDDAGRAENEAMIDDLRALLGADQVRFGRWSDSADSGVAADDWRERGIEWVLDFGGRPVEHPAVLNLPPLGELIRSGAARKALWQALRPLLAAA